MQPRRYPTNSDDGRRILEILETVDRGGNISQRALATELGLALGLINSYVRWCVRTGLIKVRQVKSRRFAYYLTPNGFAEKSRLAATHVSRSFDFFRRARLDCRDTLQAAASRGMSRLVLVGASELAEIAVICAIESSVSIVAVVDDRVARKTFLGVPVVARLEDAGTQVDGAIVTDMVAPGEMLAAIERLLGAERVLMPALLRSLLHHPKVESDEATA